MKSSRLWFVLSALLVGGAALASSHREAPFIAQHPTWDGTDFYMFRSYGDGRPLSGDGGYVTFLANYNPLQDSYGGPNYFALDPNALYEINIDNNGDAREDLTFQFRFQNSYQGLTVPTGDGKMLAIPLINLPPTNSTTPTLNRAETYTVTLVRGGRRSGNAMPVTNANGGANVFTKPVDNIGQKSIPDYAAYAAQYIYSIAIPGCSTPGKVFVGQRKEGFAVNLGEAFDLVNLNPLGKTSGNPNTIGDKNITTLALEVPVACLTADGKDAAETANPIIGAWTPSSVRQAHVFNPKPNGPATGQNASGGPQTGPEVAGGAWTQVSRLSSPLVNELVIGITDKDKFNASEPKDDAQFLDYVTNPTLPVLLNALFGDAAKVPPTPRNDLVAAFLTGVPGVNQPANVVPGEMLRLNVAVPATAASSQNNLGALQCFTNAGMLSLSNPGCDPAGFPNGRRPGDDVVDIELRVAMGALLGASDPNQKPDGSHPAYTDGVSVSAADFDNGFPYLKTPVPGSPNGQNGFPADGN
ncbi:MAG: DUF4331 domain-containing protein [Sinobacteraceae bacterium]|nr:DUF4331 domain-containing protein [Nevskiaceae bacterium]